MQEIEYMIYDTKYNDIKQILQDTLPEDNEWDVVEIKKLWKNQMTFTNVFDCTSCWWHIYWWATAKYCSCCWAKIKRVS